MIEQINELRDKYKNPKLMLYTPSRKFVAIIDDAYEVQKVMKTNDSWELSFKVFKYSENNEEIMIENGRVFNSGVISQESCQMLIRIITEEDFYIIKDVDVSTSDGKTVLSIKCLREEESLKQIIAEPIQSLGKSPEQIFNDIKTATKTCTLNYFWSGTDADPSLLRSINTTDSSSVWDNLLSLCKLFDGWWNITTDINTGNRYLFLRTKPLLSGVYYLKQGLGYKDLDISFSTKGLITRMFGYGAKSVTTGRDITILDSNPTGLPYIEDMSWFKDICKMTDEEIKSNPNCYQEGTFRDSNIADVNELYKATLKELKKKSQPEITGNITYSDLYVFEDNFIESDMDLKIGQEVLIINEDIKCNFKTTISSITKNYDGNQMDTPLEITNVIQYTNPLADLVNNIQTVNRVASVDSNGTPFVNTAIVKDSTGQTIQEQIINLTNAIAVKVSANDMWSEIEMQPSKILLAINNSSGETDVTIDSNGLTAGKFQIIDINKNVIFGVSNGEIMVHGVTLSQYIKNVIANG